jgi:lactate 2-monooxygenase
VGRAYPDRFLRALTSGRARAAVERFTQIYSRPSLTWDDLPFLRERTKLPILLKGIVHPDDARQAVDAGMDGLVVSNHGGRQLDGAIATLDALPGVVEAVDGRVPVLLDSGVRGGADMFKALALGARAVLIGRPYVYGLAIAGEAGVREVIQNFAADFDLTLGLAGCRSVDEVSRDALVRIG